MNQSASINKKTTGLLLSVFFFFIITFGFLLAAEPSSSLRDATWTWGYVIEGKLPGKVPFVSQKFLNRECGDSPFNDVTSCSLETGASYLGTPNVIFMNSNHNRNNLNAECFERVTSCKQIICALQHGSYKETAKSVSVISKKYGNITGGLIDDFKEKTGPSKAITPEETKVIYEALKSENPALKLYLVRYTWQDQNEMIPFLPYFDVINLWVWKAEEEPWQTTLEPEIDHIKEITGKPVLLGLFVHDYGKTGKPVPMKILEMQFQRATDLVRKKKIEGFVILQNGWFDHETHRPQIQWIKQYLDWVFETQTIQK
jgi:hypothetical protein